MARCFPYTRNPVAESMSSAAAAAVEPGIDKVRSLARPSSKVRFGFPEFVLCYGRRRCRIIDS
jgi:hypothetical protein